MPGTVNVRRAPASARGASPVGTSKSTAQSSTKSHAEQDGRRNFSQQVFRMLAFVGTFGFIACSTQLCQVANHEHGSIHSHLRQSSEATPLVPSNGNRPQVPRVPGNGGKSDALPTPRETRVTDAANTQPPTEVPHSPHAEVEQHLRDQREELLQSKQEAIDGEHFEKAAQLRDMLQNVDAQLQQLNSPPAANHAQEPHHHLPHRVYHTPEPLPPDPDQIHWSEVPEDENLLHLFHQSEFGVPDGVPDEDRAATNRQTIKDSLDFWKQQKKNATEYNRIQSQALKFLHRLNKKTSQVNPITHEINNKSKKPKSKIRFING